MPEPLQPDPRDAYFDVSALGPGTQSRVRKSTAFVLALSAIKLILHLGSAIVLVRLIPPEEFGIASLAMPVAMIAMHISQFGLAQPIIQMQVVTHRLVNTLFWVNLFLGIVFGGLMIAGSGLAAQHFDVPEVGPVFAVLGISVILSAALTPYIAILRRKQKLVLLENGTLIAFVVSTVVAVIAALAGASYWAVILQQVLQTLITLVLYVWGVAWKPSSLGETDLRGSTGALKFGASVSVGYMFQLVAQGLPTLVVGGQISPTAAGLYHRSVTLSRLLPERIVSPLASIFIPSLSRLQEDGPAFRALFGRAIVFLNFLLIPISVLSFSTADIFVPFILGPDWAAAAPLLAWLSLMIMQNPIDQGVVWSLNAQAARKHILMYGMVCLAVVVAALGGAYLFSAPENRLINVAIWIVCGNFAIRLPVAAWFATRATHLTAAVIARSYLPDLLIGWAAIAAILLTRQQIQDSTELVQFAVAVAILLAIYLARLLQSAVLREGAMAMVQKLRKKVG
ncbi:oligosaccharide flippase family protein [Dinoroseobacter sp. S76]|uniref:oligosaccharide flippase family protein n=1 Tax=Dinoroseobacter sp. S76 TaxID=3415124 RepID=UPI003C7D3AD6